MHTFGAGRTGNVRTLPKTQLLKQLRARAGRRRVQRGRRAPRRMNYPSLVDPCRVRASGQCKRGACGPLAVLTFAITNSPISTTIPSRLNEMSSASLVPIPRLSARSVLMIGEDRPIASLTVPASGIRVLNQKRQDGRRAADDC
jgi:hypothetical protein